jgi:hypothetical protein
MGEGRHSLRRLWRMLDAEQRMAGVGALGIILSLFMPWWRDPYPPKLSHAAINRITWIELSLLLVATVVLLLLLRRAQGRVFHLPLSDGLLAMGAGLWCSVLVIVRVIDPPTQTVGTHQFDCDLRFGFAVCLASSAVLALAGLRARRRYHRGEPEAVAADADAEPTLPMV